MRRATLRTVTATGAVLLGLSGTASAHDPDWDEKGKENTAAPSDEAPKDHDTDAKEPERWPDPFAEERKWGPVQVGGAAGYFVPWQGNGGYAVTGHVLVSSPTGVVRLGGEVLYRSYESRIFDVNDVDLDTYEVNFVFHYVFNPDGITPYVGLVTGFQINKLRKTEVQDQRPEVDVTDDTGAGWGMAAVAGIEIPLNEHFVLYGEARAGLAYQQTSSDDDDYSYYDDYDDYDTEDLGGATGVIGFRYRF